MYQIYVMKISMTSRGDVITPTARCVRGCEISFLCYQSIFSAGDNSLVKVLDCNGESQQYSVKSSSSSASKTSIFTYSYSEQITSSKVLGNQMNKP